MTCRPAPAVAAVRAQATRLWPNRSIASDGTCASATHTSQNPGSDHEPNAMGYATAVDLTDDKANGCDADAWAEHLRTTRDPRVKYVICNRRMFSSYPTSTHLAWTWRPYSGSNPHDKHTHLSITIEATFDTSPWFPQEDELTDEQADQLATANHFVKVVWPQVLQPQLARIEQHLELLAKGSEHYKILSTPVAVTAIHKKLGL